MHQTARPHALSHVLPSQSFEELLGGGGGPATVDSLRVSEWSWRLLVVRALLDSAATAPAGPLPPWRTAGRCCRAPGPCPRRRWKACWRIRPWACGRRTLRRLRGTAQDDAPLWTDTGHLHAIAAAAAVRVGLEFHTDVPVRHGWVVLPALGAMRVPGRADWGVAEVSACAGSVRIAGHRLGGRTGTR